MMSLDDWMGDDDDSDARFGIDSVTQDPIEMRSV
jgi:hypothetical protein